MRCPAIEVGKSATLSCESTSSNPGSTLEWYEGDSKMTNTHDPKPTPGENSGNTTTLQFTTRLMERNDVNGVNFTCCAINTVAGCKVNCSEVCKVNVQCKYSVQNYFSEQSHVNIYYLRHVLCMIIICESCITIS